MSPTDKSEVDEINATKEDVEAQLGTDYDRTLKQKVFHNPAELLLYLIGTLFFFYHLYYARDFPVAQDQHVIIHVGFALVFWAALKLRDVIRDAESEDKQGDTDSSARRKTLLSIGYIVYIIVVIIPTYYFFTNYESLLFGAGSYTTEEYAMGALIIVLLMIALWEISRLIFVVVILGFIYSYFGSYMPGLLSHSGLSIRRIISMNSIELNGVYGRLTLVAATWVAIFVILAGMIEKYGGMSKLIKGITKATDRYKYLKVSHVAVFGSMAFGSINGATTANAATTGAFTIPLMKENGYPPRLSAAIESVASCGGQVLPPVMGTSVFIMAELIDPSYAEIIVAATAPAVLFFAVVIISIELYTHKVGVDPQSSKKPTEEGSWYDPILDVLKNYEYIGMVIVLLYWLVYIQADPLLAGYWSIATLIVLRIVRMLHTAVISRDSNFTGQLRDFGRQSIEGFKRGAESAIEISIMVAALGIIVRAFIVTGFAQSLSRSLIAIGGGSVILMVLLAALASIVFGMGMPTVAAYLLVALFVAPPLADVLPISILAVHMFVFYFAIVSNITPPIAVAVVITQGIAGSDFLETSIDSLRIGFPLFILPFLFVFNETLLDPSLILLPTMITLAVGFLAVSVALIGYNNISIPIRGGFLIVGFVALFVQQLLLQIILAVFILVIFMSLTPRAREIYTSVRGSH